MPQSYDSSRYFRAALCLIDAQGVLPLDVLAQRAGVTPNTAYHCELAFRGVCEALRVRGYLGAETLPPGEVIESTSEVVSLEEAQRRLAGLPQQTARRVTAR